jgi:uncharacterized protein (TIRG00374 family)
MPQQQQEAKKILDTRRIILPVLLGIAVGAYLIYTSIDMKALSSISWGSAQFLGWFAIALLLIAARGFFYMYRLRVISDYKLSWGQAFQVIMLWEFSSCVTPGLVGGAAVAIFLLNKERIPLGKSTAMVVLVTFLDNLVFILFIPLLILLIGPKVLFATGTCAEADQLPVLQYVESISMAVILIYLVLLLLTVILGYGIIGNPRAAKYFFLRLSRMSIFKKWKAGLVQTGEEMELAGKEFRVRSKRFWYKVFGSTVAVWLSRFLLANALILAVTGLGNDQIMILARQFVVWMVMILPSTPGGSGIAEIAFMAFICEFIPDGLSSALVVLWRLLSYYLYLVVGAFVLPRWLTRVFKKDPA